MMMMEFDLGGPAFAFSIVWMHMIMPNTGRFKSSVLKAVKKNL